MSLERFPPDDPKEWLNRARSNLARARGGINLPDVYLEDLCFDAQQAAEKAIKALLIHLEVRFPYIHDLGQLLALVEQAGRTVPEQVKEAARLSDYAVEARYPGLAEPVTGEEYEEAVTIATEVIHWVSNVIENRAARDHQRSEGAEG
jgi:HEPN domain-containing protein